MRAAEDVVWCPVEGEIVLFSASASRYYGLDDVASRIWTRVTEGADSDGVLETLLSEFEVDSETAQTEVNRCLEELIELRLLVCD